MDLQERLRDPALLIVDMQNDFVRVGAPLEVPDARATIAGAPAADRGGAPARPAGRLHQVPLASPNTTCSGNGRRSAGRRPSAAGRATGAATRTSDGELDCTDVVDEIYPEPDDPIVEKYGYGAFHDDRPRRAAARARRASRCWSPAR